MLEKTNKLEVYFYLNKKLNHRFIFNFIYKKILITKTVLGTGISSSGAKGKVKSKSAAKNKRNTDVFERNRILQGQYRRYNGFGNTKCSKTLFEQQEL